MLFSREYLRELIWGGDPADCGGTELIGIELIDRDGLYVNLFELTFSFGSKVYSVTYEEGKNEEDHIWPFENDNDPVECNEVES